VLAAAAFSISFATRDVAGRPAAAKRQKGTKASLAKEAAKG